MKRKLDQNDVPVEVPESASQPSTTDVPKAASFSDFGLDSRLLQGVARQGFTRPTSIQAQQIPLALAGKDVLGMSMTVLPPLVTLSNVPNKHAQEQAPARPPHTYCPSSKQSFGARRTQQSRNHAAHSSSCPQKNLATRCTRQSRRYRRSAQRTSPSST